MDNDSLILLGSIGMLICLSAFFSATETAFSSLNRIRIKNMANNGDRKAQKVLDLIDNYDKLITTILVGNNIVNIVGASLATIFFVKLDPVNGVSISSAVMTVLVLIFGEITPKTIAKEFPVAFALSVVNIMSFLTALLTPINALSTAWKKALGAIFKFSAEDTMSQEELLTIVEEAQQEGGINEHDGNLISNAIEFNELEVKDILTPRVDIVAIDIEDTMDEIEEVFRTNGYSRLPVYEGSIDNIIGVIHEKDFYRLYLSKETTIRNSVQDVLYTSPYIRVNELLRQVQSAKSHLSVVIDEYGGTAGIITLEDILEEIVGEIWDEHDEVIEYFKQIDEDNYLVECNANLEEMFEYLDIEMKEDYEFTTVSAWVISLFDKIPEVGEHISYENLDLIVSETDGKTVQSIKIHVNHETEESDDKEN